MSNPRPLTQRERDLIERYSYCQLGMTPKRFYAKWDVNYETISLICVSEAGRSPSLTRYSPALVPEKPQLSPSESLRLAPSCPHGLSLRAFRGDS